MFSVVASDYLHKMFCFQSPDQLTTQYLRFVSNTTHMREFVFCMENINILRLPSSGHLRASDTEKGQTLPGREL